MRRIIDVTPNDIELMNVLVREYRHRLFMSYKDAKNPEEIVRISRQIATINNVAEKFLLTLDN